MGHTVIFQPSGRRGEVEDGVTLLDAAHELGVDIEALCGSARVCGKCKVKLEEGFFEKFGIESKTDNLSKLLEEEKDFFSPEELADNYRLACCAYVHGNVLVFVPEESRGAKQVILELGRERAFDLNPLVANYYIELIPATLEDQTNDITRIKNELAAKYGLTADLAVDYPLLQTLPGTIRDAEWKVTVTVWDGKEIIKVSPGLKEDVYGLAIDVGTTTVAAYVCNLRTGAEVSKGSIMNPQVRYGEDVLSRITYAMMNDDGLSKMSGAIIEGINSLVDRLTEEAGIRPGDLVDMTLVFNTAMHHILLNIDPKYLGRAPFAPVISNSVDIKARDLGVKISHCAYVHCLPVEAGFVGPDNVSVLIAEEPYKQDKMILVIDIGTNGEIDFGNREKLFSTSCATGPALEGAQIKFGMRAAPSAVEGVIIDPETKEPKYKLIGQDKWWQEGDEPIARGICGSGIIDVIAEMFKSGVIQSSGRVNQKTGSSRVRKGADGKWEYVLCWAKDTAIGKDITVTQGDVRAVQLAKSALYVGAQYLMEKRGVDKPDSVTLAGAFGSYINKESAMVIGMFPDCDLENVQAVGNAAGDGAKLALLSKNKRDEAEKVARFVEFIETATEPDFQTRFADAMAFPHSKDPFPHIQHILDKIPK
ncbi:MAG: ASKHA domain-containing protein [Firmicutes bacterium]|nr:ASKHA domain-containing protein [Bacillota bacterium]